MTEENRFGCPQSIRREVYEAHTYIMSHYMEELSWKDVAEHVGLSGNYLRTLYMEVYDRSLNRTLMGCRMQHAADLLVRTTRTVREISLDSRYQDTAYFCRRFKEWSGMTPTEFRKRYTVLPLQLERA